jgi:hypothetical protein
MLLSQSAGNALLTKLEERNPDGSFRYANLVDLDTGLYIQFHQAGTQRAVAGPRTMSMTGGGGRAADNMKYEVEILEDYNGILPTFDGIHELVAAHVRAWDDIIRIPTYEEQVGLLCNAGLPESAIVYALGDVYGEIIPQHVHEKARAQMGGGGPVVGAVSTTNQMQRPAASGAANPMQRRAPAPAVAPPPPAEDDVPFDAQAPQEPQASTPAPAPVAAQAAAPAQAAAFDGQPTHAEPGRTQATAAALARARNRAKQAQ